MKRYVLGCVLALGAGACGGSGPHSDRGTGTEPVVPCTITLSGAVAGSYACGTHTAAWASSNDQSGVALSYGTPGITDPSVTAAIGFTGEPHAGTFTDADADAKSGITVTSGGGYWGEQVGGGSPKTGSYTLVLTSVTTMFTNSDGKGYTVHGTLDGSLPVIAGGSGSVTVHVSF